jgi:predicted ATPase
MMTTLSTAERTAPLLERAGTLASLAAWAAAVNDEGSGRLVFVCGEAGVGKTLLLRRFCDEQAPAARVLWGSCDPLFTPRPLGPLVDVAGVTGGELAELVEREARPHEVAAALLRELAAKVPTVVVIEDVHWADEGTLDVLRLLGRRVRGTPAQRGSGSSRCHARRLRDSQSHTTSMPKCCIGAPPAIPSSSARCWRRGRVKFRRRFATRCLRARLA